MKGLRLAASAIERPVASRVGIDLIYEGITTRLIDPFIHDSDEVGIDLIYEGITTQFFSCGFRCFWVGIDLIYEGITT